MSDKKMTAIEWLQSIEMERDLTLGDWSKAKEMEKQQTITAMINTDTSKQNITEIVAKGMKYWKETYEQ